MDATCQRLSCRRQFRKLPGWQHGNYHSAACRKADYREDVLGQKIDHAKAIKGRLQQMSVHPMFTAGDNPVWWELQNLALSSGLREPEVRVELLRRKMREPWLDVEFVETELNAAATEVLADVCRFCLALADADIHGKPWPRLNVWVIELLGEPCATCRPVLAAAKAQSRKTKPPQAAATSRPRQTKPARALTASAAPPAPAPTPDWIRALASDPDAGRTIAEHEGLAQFRPLPADAGRAAFEAAAQAVLDRERTQGRRRGRSS
jgi:hypothetical protein